MCISGIYAFTNTSILKIQNKVNTGAINIELKEYTIENGVETLYSDSENVVLPGEIVSLIPRISNIGDSSYVRAKISYTGEGNNVIPITDENLKGMDNDWVKKGDYWYYKKEVKSGENIDVFKNLTIPSDLSNEYQDKTIQINVVAEAVQSANFSPNFESNSPWNGVNAENSDNTYEADKVQIASTAKIEYENSANLYINVPENFFTELAHVVPGDIISEEVSINNKKDTSVEYVVSTEKPVEISGKAEELLDKLKLKIVSEKGVIYEGKAYKIENLSLGTYEPNSMDKLTFTITVPEELGNEYANLNSAINWSFGISQKEKTEQPEVPQSPQTGDIKIKIAIGIFIIATIAFIMILILGKNKKDK